jgi:hypothetical protein
MLVFQTLLDSLLANQPNRFQNIKLVLNFRKLLDVNEIQIRGSLDMRGVQISLMLILSDILLEEELINLNLVLKRVVTLEPLEPLEKEQEPENSRVKDHVIIPIRIPEDTNARSADFVGLFISDFAVFSKHHNSLYGANCADFFFDYPAFTRQEIFEMNEYQLMCQAMNEDGLHAKLRALKKNELTEKK